MRIVHIITCLLRGGSEENTLATCRLQAARGYDVTLIHGREADPQVLASVPSDIKTIQCDALRRAPAPRSDLATLSGLTRILRDIAPIVVHTHASKAGFLGRLAASRAKVPIIVHGVHILPFLNTGRLSGAFYLACERFVAPKTDAYIAVSQGMRTANLAAGLGTADTNHTVYSGMDVDRFRKALPLMPRPEGRWLVMVASLEARKRHAEFLPVFARLAAQFPDLHLALLGIGPEEAALRAQAKSLGIANCVQFLGYRDDVERWIATSEVCVLASAREGLPRSIIQAVAGGRPVVVSALPGLEEIVANGENGFVTSADNVADMEEPLRQLISDQALTRAMGAASRARDVSRWSEVQMEAEIDDILRALVLRKGVAGNPSSRARIRLPKDPLDRASHR